MELAQASFQIKIEGKTKWIAALRYIAFILALPAHEAEITIGVATEPCAVVPHHHNLGSNIAMKRHIFESLIIQDETQALMLGLA